MSLRKTDYYSGYREAQQAYCNNSFPEAEAIAKQLRESFPDDAHLLLLSGHISLKSKNLEQAAAFYQRVLDVDAQPECQEFALQGLAQIERYESQAKTVIDPASTESLNTPSIESKYAMVILGEEPQSMAIENVEKCSDQAATSNSLEEETQLIDSENQSNDEITDSLFETSFSDNVNGKAIDKKATKSFGIDTSESPTNASNSTTNNTRNLSDLNRSKTENISRHKNRNLAQNSNEAEPRQNDSNRPLNMASVPSGTHNKVPEEIVKTKFSISDIPEDFLASEKLSDTGTSDDNRYLDQLGLDEQNGAGLDNIDSAQLEGNNINRLESGRLETSAGKVGSELDSLDYSDLSSQLLDSQSLEPFDTLEEIGENVLNQEYVLPEGHFFEESFDNPSIVHNSSELGSRSLSGEIAFIEADDHEFAQDEGIAVPSEISSDDLVGDEQNESPIESKGITGLFWHASLRQKQLITAAAAATTSAIATALILVGVVQTTPAEQRAGVMNTVTRTGLLSTLFAGAVTFGVTAALTKENNKQIKLSTDNLQQQLKAVSQGHLDAKATIYSNNEFGELAQSFNDMTTHLVNTTGQTQIRAQEIEQSQKELQRQVIRLLDDVEGAAQGDFTVQAEVTADILGAVADAFNLTIQNLRVVVQKVKRAARQVNKNASDSESFARGLSSDALHQAEELAGTLNSVQMMTDSIQRVAENAREAEKVARAASRTALKGGESVDYAVAGILQIRETVAETTRKVKRLAESSQEISQIVAVVSQIATRTNLLALNASVAAARAGESGKGFAVVADEVHQLADRSANALMEIERIVQQIQSETRSVMMAMEEGTQQVIDGTKRAEQAKQSLDDIIKVSKYIDTLVRSITADTVQQRENSRAVTEVMETVALNAQETSYESQRVAESLQKLVLIARELLGSVDSFRTEADD